MLEQSTVLKRRVVDLFFYSVWDVMNTQNLFGFSDWDTQ